jgi:hypothetical protein
MHRVTLLRNDPAAGWLTGSGRMGVLLKWGGVWVGYFLLVRVVFFVAKVAMDTSSLAAFDVTVMGWSFPRLAAVAVAALMLVPARHLANVVRAGAQARAAKQDAGDEAQAIDDYAALAEQAEGTVVSLVGWVRGHGYLEHTVGGHQAVGLALPCRGLTVVETLHNFDLVDEAGATALVVAQGARLLGQPKVPISRVDAEDRALLHELNLPAGVVPTYWTAFVVRDGDPVMVIGTKATVHDMTELQHGRAAARTAVTSQAKRPLLIVPLDAERRDV